MKTAMKLTEEEIDKHARAYSLTPNYFATTNQMRHKAFADGAKWKLSQSQWIPVEERLPEDKEPKRYLVFIDDCISLMWYNPEYPVGFVAAEVTYWMELPKNPKTE